MKYCQYCIVFLILVNGEYVATRDESLFFFGGWALGNFLEHYFFFAPLGYGSFFGGGGGEGGRGTGGGNSFCKNCF